MKWADRAKAAATRNVEPRKGKAVVPEDVRRCVQAERRELTLSDTEPAPPLERAESRGEPTRSVPFDITNHAHPSPGCVCRKCEEARRHG